MLAQLHEALKEPLRRKILLKLGQNKSLSLNDLAHFLGFEDSKELSYQLGALEKLTVEGEPLLLKLADERYSLTEKGHSVLEELIAFPELASENYRGELGKDARGGRRFYYVFVGAFVVGGLFWFALTLFMMATGLRWQLTEAIGNGGFDVFSLAALLICWFIGGVLCDLIGKKYDYKIWRTYKLWLRLPSAP